MYLFISVILREVTYLFIHFGLGATPRCVQGLLLAWTQQAAGTGYHTWCQGLIQGWCMQGKHLIHRTISLSLVEVYFYFLPFF